MIELPLIKLTQIMKGMYIMNNCFLEEVNKTVKDIKNVMTDKCICFALLTDSKLSDYGDETSENIKAVDKEVGFSFVAHLGNITNGDNPELITRYLMATELEMYKNSVSSKKLFVTEGFTDGYRDERFMGQLMMRIMTDEIWTEETAFIDKYENVKRKSGKPYYYVDIPDKKIRLVFLSSYFSQIDKCLGLYEKYLRIDVEQAAWLKTEALDAPEGYTAVLFSHALPKSRFEEGKDPFIYNGYSTEPILMIIQQAKMRGVNVAGWFAGAYGYDAEAEVAGINHIVINSQAPYINTESKVEGVRFAQNREIGTVNQDCWDAVVLNPETKEFHIFRFGCGEDRKLTF